MSAQCWYSSEVVGLRKARFSRRMAIASPQIDRYGSHFGSTYAMTGIGKTIVPFAIPIEVSFELSHVQGPRSRLG